MENIILLFKGVAIGCWIREYLLIPLNLFDEYTQYVRLSYHDLWSCLKAFHSVIEILRKTESINIYILRKTKELLVNRAYRVLVAQHNLHFVIAYMSLLFLSGRMSTLF